MSIVRNTTRLTTLLVANGLCMGPVFACSLVNVATSTAEAIALSYYYWLASGVLGLAIVFIEFRRRRRSLVLALTAALLVFHPAWTVSPLYGTDCNFINVQASQAVLAVIALLLVYQLARVMRLRRSGT